MQEGGVVHPGTKQAHSGMLQLHEGASTVRRSQLAPRPTAHVYLSFWCRLDNRYPIPGGSALHPKELLHGAQ